MLTNILVWGGYIALFVWLARMGRGHDALVSGSVSFWVQALAYVSTYISAVALVGFGGLAHTFGLQMLLVAAGNVWLGTWLVYRFLAWPTRRWQERLKARTPTQLLALGHNSPTLGRVLAVLFAIFLGVYASAVIKGAALLLAQIVPVPASMLVWIVAGLVGFAVMVGGLRGVLYTEAMQGMVMLAGIVMLMLAVFAKVGGPVQGIEALAALPATSLANNGFVGLSGGEQGLFIWSLVVVTSVAVWAQPQMIQRHFALSGPRQVSRITPLAMLILTVLVGGAYFSASLSRLFLTNAPTPDDVMPMLVKMLLPEAGLHIFVLAIVSASLSTATAIFHIAVSAVAEDLPGRKATRASWCLGIVFCVLLSGGCAQIKGQLIALLCTTSWSLVGATVLVPYVALVRFGSRQRCAAWWSASAGFLACLGWYLLVYGPTSMLGVPMVGPLGHAAALTPPFFVGFGASLAGWFGAMVLQKKSRQAIDDGAECTFIAR